MKLYILTVISNIKANILLTAKFYQSNYVFKSVSYTSNSFNSRRGVFTFLNAVLQKNPLFFHLLKSFISHLIWIMAHGYLLKRWKNYVNFCSPTINSIGEKKLFKTKYFLWNKFSQKIFCEIKKPVIDE